MECNSGNHLAPMPPICGSSPKYPSSYKNRSYSRMENTELGCVNDLSNFGEMNECKVDDG